MAPMMRAMSRAVFSASCRSPARKTGTPPPVTFSLSVVTTATIFSARRGPMSATAGVPRLLPGTGPHGGRPAGMAAPGALQQRRVGGGLDGHGHVPGEGGHYNAQGAGIGILPGHGRQLRLGDFLVGSQGRRHLVEDGLALPRMGQLVP